MGTMPITKTTTTIWRLTWKLPIPDKTNQRLLAKERAQGWLKLKT